MNKILIIDDEVRAVMFLKRILERKGYEVITSFNGEKALEVIKYEKLDIILLDIRMPGIDGIEVLRRVRKFCKNVGIIMVTAINDKEVGIKALESGANGYITKPIDLNHLETIIRDIMFEHLP
ncbi:MAG: two-component response regulator [Candidatus Scalindua rubra]|uniref:Two-component response regulator n=1 Tax=Candidatus Scalindua rubra TaxID=1872076 RepID=A0A1E3X9G6_9BACT|nr:MAG: two-component response regulator [Candidatus Scalindua rubra]